MKHDLPVRKLDFLLASQRGGYWLLADGRIQKWTTNRFERDWGTYPWNNATVSAACEDRQGNLVVGTLGAGLFWFDPEGKATSTSRGEGNLNRNYSSINSSVMIDAGGDILELFYFPQLDMFAGNFEREKVLRLSSEFGVRSAELKCTGKF